MGGHTDRSPRFTIVSIARIIMGVLSLLIALSEVLLCWTAVALSQSQQGHFIRVDQSRVSFNPDPLYTPDSVGHLIIALASFVGALRFGIFSSLAGVHQWLAGLAGCVGTPLLGIRVALVAWPMHEFAMIFTKNAATNTLVTLVVLTASYVTVDKAGIGQEFARIMPIAFVFPLGAVGIFSNDANLAVPAIVALLLLIIAVAAFSAWEDSGSAMIAFHVFFSMALYCAQALVVGATSPRNSGIVPRELWEIMHQVGPLIGKS